MAIVNTLAHTASYTGGTVRTYSVTVPAGDDRILFVTHANDDPDVSGGFSVTYNGVALTKLAGNGANTNGMAVYYLVNPAVGAHDLVWTNISTYTSGLFGEYVFTGVDQTTPLGTPFTLFQPYVSSSTSASFTSVDGGVLFSFAQIRQTTGVVQTSPADLLTSDVYSTWIIGAAKSQPGATSIGWQGWGDDKQVNHVAVMMNPAESGPVDATTTGGTGTSTGSGSGGAATGSSGGTDATTTGGTGTSTGSGSGGSATGASAATITLRAIDFTTSELRVSETGVEAIINELTGALVLRQTGLSIDAAGDCPIANAAFTSGAEYRCTTIHSDGSEGTWRYTAV